VNSQGSKTPDVHTGSILAFKAFMGPWAIERKILKIKKHVSFDFEIGRTLKRDWQKHVFSNLDEVRLTVKVLELKMDVKRLELLSRSIDTIIPHQRCGPLSLDLGKTRGSSSNPVWPGNLGI